MERELLPRAWSLRRQEGEAAVQTRNTLCLVGGDVGAKVSVEG